MARLSWDGAARGSGALGSTRRPLRFRPILVLRKARRVMETLSLDAPGGATFTTVLERSGLPSSTCLRILHGLVEAGFLDREGDCYRPSRLLTGWAWAGLDGTDLPRRATPVLERLRDETGESACLFVRQGAIPTIVALAETRHPVAYVLRIGQPMSTPLSGAAGGKVFLAYAPEAIDAGAQRTAGGRRTGAGSAAARLRAELAEVRRRGYAVKFGERLDSLSAISAPVFDFRGSLIAAMGIVAPSHRMDRRVAARWAPLVVVAARSLSTHSSEGEAAATTSRTAHPHPLTR